MKQYMATGSARRPSSRARRANARQCGHHAAEIATRRSGDERFTSAISRASGSSVERMKYVCAPPDDSQEYIARGTDRDGTHVQTTINSAKGSAQKGAFVLAVVAFQIFSCYRRSRALQRRDDNHNNSARYEPRSSRRSSRHPNGVSSARADVSPGTANGTAFGSPATALEMARAEPVVGIPVWMDTSGAMLNGMVSQGLSQRGHGGGEEEENAEETSARMAAVECNREG